MTQRFDKLVALLQELFQLDQPDLDFGFYRVMHAKSAEVTQFLEKNLLPQVKAAFAQYQPADKAAIEKGDALEILARHPGPFDIIFCDIDKRDYPKVHPLMKPRLRAGGLFICDNMLWSGRVADAERQDDDTRGVRELTRLLYADTDLATTILPLRDGVSISLKAS